MAKKKKNVNLTNKDYKQYVNTDVKAVISNELTRKSVKCEWEEPDPRYVIINAETGEILDDAQGYGYKSAPKAYAAWNYKVKGPSKGQRERAEIEKIRERKSNKTASRNLDYAFFYAMKDHCEITMEEAAKLAEPFDLDGTSITHERLAKWIVTGK